MQKSYANSSLRVLIRGSHLQSVALAADVGVGAGADAHPDLANKAAVCFAAKKLMGKTRGWKSFAACRLKTRKVGIIGVLDAEGFYRHFARVGG